MDRFFILAIGWNSQWVMQLHRLFNPNSYKFNPMDTQVVQIVSKSLSGVKCPVRISHRLVKSFFLLRLPNSPISSPEMCEIDGRRLADTQIAIGMANWFRWVFTFSSKVFHSMKFIVSSPSYRAKLHIFCLGSYTQTDNLWVTQDYQVPQEVPRIALCGERVRSPEVAHRVDYRRLSYSMATLKRVRGV